MEVTVLQDKLEKGLSALARVIAPKAQLPILSNILVEAKTGEIILSATNLNESIKVRIPAKVETPGSLTIPGKLFVEFIHLLPNKPITLQVKNQTMHVVAENVQADFAGIAATEFPKLPLFTEPVFATLQLATLRQLVSEVCFAASKDEGRPVLTGAMLKMTPKTLQLVATDGFRLSVSEVAQEGLQEEQQILVPAKMLEELVRLAAEFLPEKQATIMVSLLPEQNQLVARIGTVELSFRLLEGNFPDYAKVIPQETQTTIVIDREDLLKAAKLASVFSKDGLSVIKMAVATDSVTLASDAKEVGNDSIKVAAQVEGEGGEIAFNPRFLLEFLQTIDKEHIEIAMSSPLSPAVFRKHPTDDFLHVIMPVRT